MKPRKKKTYNMELFGTGEDLPLFSGIAQNVKDETYQPTPSQEPEKTDPAQLTMDSLPHIEVKKG